MNNDLKNAMGKTDSQINFEQLTKIHTDIQNRLKVIGEVMEAHDCDQNDTDETQVEFANKILLTLEMLCDMLEID